VFILCEIADFYGKANLSKIPAGFPVLPIKFAGKETPKI